MQIIKLTPSQPNITGLLNSDDAIVLCNSALGSFAISVPLAQSTKNRKISFKNIGNGLVSLVFMVNSPLKYYDVSTVTLLIPSGKCVEIFSDIIENKWYLFGNDYNRFGDQGNYTEFESDGTMVFHGDARIYRDELGDVTTLQQQGTGVSSNASEGSVEFVTVANLSDYLRGNVQLNHDRDLTATIYPHIHAWQTTANSPNYLIQYRWQINGGSKTTAWTSLKCNTQAFTYTGGTLNQIFYANPIVPPIGTSLSDIIQFRVLRDNANTSTVFTGSDPVSATVSLTSFDVHFVGNKNGSRELFVY